MISREERALDATYRTFGLAAEYDDGQGGGAQSCTVILLRPGNPKSVIPPAALRFTGSGAIEVAHPTLDILVRLSEVEAPQKGGAFKITDTIHANLTGKVFPIGQEPTPNDSDGLGLEWRCSTSMGGPDGE